MNQPTLRLLQSGGFADVFLHVEGKTCYKIFHRPGSEKREFSIAKYMIEKRDHEEEISSSSSSVVKYFECGYFPKQVALEIYKKALPMDDPKLAFISESFRNEESVPYVSMEYIEGMDALEFGLKQGSLDELLAVDLMIATTRAVQELHSYGLLHRDLKPDNLMIYQDASSSQHYAVKLIDLGLASRKPATDSQSTFEMHIGTARYLAPEALKGWHSTASDLYSIAVSFYMLRGSPTDTSSRYMQLLLKLTDLNPRYRGSLAEAIQALVDIRTELIATHQPRRGRASSSLTDTESLDLIIDDMERSSSSSSSAKRHDSAISVMFSFEQSSDSEKRKFNDSFALDVDVNEYSEEVHGHQRKAYQQLADIDTSMKKKRISMQDLAALDFA
jgi:serine/threonine protein kinase